MPILARLVESEAILPLRTRCREELNCQIVHDSIHRRAGGTRSYELEQDGVVAGFGSVAVAGPWQDRPTLFEFYLLSEFRSRAFELFEVFLAASGSRYFEVQSDDALLTALRRPYGDVYIEVWSPIDDRVLAVTSCRN